MDHRNINQITSDLPKDTHPPINIGENGIQILRLRGDVAVWKTVPHSGDGLDAVIAVVAGELLEVLDNVRVVDAGDNLNVEEQRVGAVEGRVLDLAAVVPFTGADLLVSGETGRRQRSGRRGQDKLGETHDS